MRRGNELNPGNFFSLGLQCQGPDQCPAKNPTGLEEWGLGLAHFRATAGIAFGVIPAKPASGSSHEVCSSPVRPRLVCSLEYSRMQFSISLPRNGPKPQPHSSNRWGFFAEHGRPCNEGQTYPAQFIPASSQLPVFGFLFANQLGRSFVPDSIFNFSTLGVNFTAFFNMVRKPVGNRGRVPRFSQTAASPQLQLETKLFFSRPVRPGPISMGVLQHQVHIPTVCLSSPAFPTGVRP